MAIINYPIFKAFDSSGNLLSGGLLYTYEAGSSTPKTIYSDYAMTVPHANPIVLDSNGEAEIYGTGGYKFVLKTAAGVTIWTLDNYYPAGGLIGALSPEADKFPYFTSSVAAALTAITALGRSLVARATAQLMRNDLDAPSRALSEISATVAGTDTYTANLDPAITAYTTGAYYFITFTNANTGAATLNLNGLGVKAIITQDGAALTAQKIRAGMHGILKYDGTSMVLLNESTAVGSIIAWPASSVPAGYLECDGSSLLRATYAALFAIISDDYGAADGTHFTLPDYRGRFLRGWAHGQTTDPDKATRTDRGDGTGGDVVGSKQADEQEAHTHGAQTPAINVTTDIYSSGGGTEDYINTATSGILGSSTTLVTATQAAHTHASVGGNETRPININVLYCIKY
jgi:microcystin-dependent protein